VLSRARSLSLPSVRARAGDVLAVLTALAALASALVGGWFTVRTLDDWRTTYGQLEPELRDDPVALFLGFDDATWEALARVVGEADRYAVVATGERRFEVRNYAAYRLLPAIQVARPRDADVVVYYATAGPGDCRQVGKEACVVRIGR
jgi:hypothetical protein